MKPSLTLTLVFVTILSACARGNSTPTTPSSNPLFVRLTFVPQPAVTNEATTFTASITPASSLARAILDFEDGTLADLSPLSPVNSATWEHVYTRAGDFTAKFSVRSAAGETASGYAIVFVR